MMKADQHDTNKLVRAANGYKNRDGSLAKGSWVQ